MPNVQFSADVATTVVHTVARDPVLDDVELPSFRSRFNPLSLLRRLEDAENAPAPQIEVDLPAEKNTKLSFRKIMSFIGPGFFISIGYMDPGNWATDISGGSMFGYDLAWVLLLSNLIALLLQTLATRLGLVTNLDLAQQCRAQYPRPVRITLWLLCEIAIIATDLAEVIGTAIGLQLLTGLPLLAGILLTVADTLIFLVIQRYGIRKLELGVLVLLAIIGVCFIVELFLAKPVAIDVLKGFVPSLTNESVYIAMGIIGATVMPHNFYLHSSVVQSRKFGRKPEQIRQACAYNLIDIIVALNFAFFINLSILIVAGAVFYTRGLEVTELQEAHNLLEGLLDSRVAPIVFGLALFCSGQSSTLTGTMAGQIVMEGFLELRMKPWLRRLITRCFAVVPAAVVVSIMGDAGVYDLLVLSQVVLSMQLPFAIVPLIKFTSDRRIMGSFVNKIWMTLFSWAFSLVIVGLNFWVLADTVKDLIEMSLVGVITACVIVIPLMLALVGLLFWLTFRGVLFDHRPYVFSEHAAPQVDDDVTEAVPLESLTSSSADIALRGTDDVTL
eukprot:TRINITY_DN4337_c0_g1_i1.p1 TRINITY_DN4337_c0_g1~~TRINITY_DN4337_c0_g1_i1.p1  ORF type:complete len:557 (-),score=241.80 TRINITY_DN4337_c0_g1_i1:418-2088(-)